MLAFLYNTISINGHKGKMMDIFNKEKIAELELEVDALTSQCKILREGNAHMRGELKDCREREVRGQQNTYAHLGRTWEGIK